MTSTDQPTPFAVDQAVDQASVINQMLDLDDLLASEVRRAEVMEPLYTKPHLEAEINALELELQSLTNGSGASVARDDEAAVGDEPAAGADGRTADVVAREIQAKRQEYAASARMVRLRQLPSEDWLAFETKWKTELGKGAPYPPAMWDDLIAQSAVQPEMPLAKVNALRSRLGNPPLYNLAMRAWKLNTEGGVAVPFSQLSSLVLRPKERGTS